MMSPMEPDPYAGRADPSVARLRLHRPVGVAYAAVALVVLALVVLGGVDFATTGRIVMALVVIIAGMLMVAFLGYLSVSVLVPELRLSADGIEGRMNWGRPLDVDWDDVTVDVDDDASPGRFQLSLGGEAVEITARAWVGFADFVVLLASTPAAARRLTPGARHEVARLLQIEDR